MDEITQGTHGMQGYSIVLEIPSDVQPGDDHGSPLILTIRFRLEGGTQAVFEGAEVIGQQYPERNDIKK